jgi:hypothetical protein
MGFPAQRTLFFGEMPMLPDFLLPETTVNAKGSGPACEVGADAGKTLLLTLGILDIVEQEALDVTIVGSADGQEWSAPPLRMFPQKFYRGTWQILMDLALHPEIKFLRVDWAVQRWGVGSQTPMFQFYVFAEPFEESATRQKTA